MALSESPWFPDVVTFGIYSITMFIIWSPLQGKCAFSGMLTKQFLNFVLVAQDVNISKLGWDDRQVRTKKVVAWTLWLSLKPSVVYNQSLTMTL